MLKHAMSRSLKYNFSELILLRMPPTLPCMGVLVLLLLGSAGADGSQRVVEKNLGGLGGRLLDAWEENLGGGGGSLLGAWEEKRRHGRAPPDSEEMGGRDLLRESIEVE